MVATRIADKPEIRDSFLVIFALMALARGVRSAATKFCANEFTSTPEPALSELIKLCAAALFEAANWLDVAVDVVAVFAVDVVELTAVVAMRRLSSYWSNRTECLKLE